MNNRLPQSPKIPNDYGFSSQKRRNKKSNCRKKHFANDYNCNDEDGEHQEPSEDELPGIEYRPVFYQGSSLPPTHPQQVQSRCLATAMSDPSVCTYPHPIAYGIEPIAIPSWYRVYQPTVLRPKYKNYYNKLRKPPKPQKYENLNTDNHDYFNLQENLVSPMFYQTGDCTSLPPNGNFDKIEHVNDINSEPRRYSDPGLGPAGIPPNSKSDDSDSVDSCSSTTTVEKNKKLFATLIEQITKMKETESQLFKELHEAKAELESVKTELSQFKQSYSSNYQPGMLSEIIREIRKAGKINEDMMLQNIKTFMDSQESKRLIDIEHVKNELEIMRVEKEQHKKRVFNLEKEVLELKDNLTVERLLEDKSLTNTLKSECNEQSIQSTTDVTYGMENLEIPNNFDIKQVYDQQEYETSENTLYSNGKISNNHFSIGPVTDL